MPIFLTVAYFYEQLEGRQGDKVIRDWGIRNWGITGFGNWRTGESELRIEETGRKGMEDEKIGERN